MREAHGGVDRLIEMAGKVASRVAESKTGESKVFETETKKMDHKIHPNFLPKMKENIERSIKIPVRICVLLDFFVVPGS